MGFSFLDSRIGGRAVPAIVSLRTDSASVLVPLSLRRAGADFTEQSAPFAALRVYLHQATSARGCCRQAIYPPA